MSFIEVISVECFDKIRHSQKIFPLKNIKGFKCIYNELERKGSLPYIEQKRATSSSPQTRKINPPIPQITRSNTKTSPMNSPPPNHRNIEQQKSIISYSLRQSSEDRQSPNRHREHSLTPLRNSNPSPIEGDPLVMKYQTIPKYRTNFQILRPTRIMGEEWDNFDRRDKTRLSIGAPKSLVLISKNSTENKSIQPLQT